ncbi:unannotated protein [freshwater metagenome]|uniref:Unannotated protein n=1 Tax=freshwater metagenome TaxID=449393 RepID=A0A6J6IVA8_9ZZZZ
MGGEVFIAKAKPGGLNAIGGEFIFGGEGFTLAAPAALSTYAITQGVHHGVQVWAHPHAMNPDVIAGVADDRDRSERAALAVRVDLAKVGEQADQEAGTADSTRKYGHASRG